MELTEEEFAGAVEEALARLPKRFKRRLENIAVIVEKRPSKRLLQEMGLDPKRDALYGVYEGTPISERSPLHAPIFPDRITIFSEPLTRDFPDPDELRRQIRITVIHEVGHYFGLDDRKIRKLGY